MGDPDLDPDEMRKVTEAAVDTLRQLGDVGGLAVAERYLGLALFRQGHVAEASAVLERAVVDADTSGDQDTRRFVIGTLVNCYWQGPAPVDEAIGRGEELLQSARNDRVLVAVITRFLSVLFAMAARFDEARELGRTSSLVLDELNLNSYWVYRGATAEAKELAGDRAGAERELLAQWHWFSNHGDRAIDDRAMSSAYKLAYLYCDDDRWDDAANCLSFGSGVALVARPTHRTIYRLAGEARIAAHSGRFPHALTLAQRAVDYAELTDSLNLRARIWMALAEVQRAGGAAAEADAALATAIRLYEAKGNLAAAARLR